VRKLTGAFSYLRRTVRRIGGSAWEGTSSAIGYAKFHSRSHDAVIRVYDAAAQQTEVATLFGPS